MKLRFWDGIWLSVVVALAIILWVQRCNLNEKISALESSTCSVDTMAILDAYPSPTDTLWLDSIVYVSRLVDLTDTAAVQSLRTELAKMRVYWTQRERQLLDAIQERETALALGRDALDHLQDMIRYHTLEDSVTTDRYKLWIRASAQGPIDWVTYDVRVFPEIRTVADAGSAPKLNSVFLLAGGQVDFREASFRPVFSLGYRRRWLMAQVGYLPFQSNNSTWQVSAGGFFQF